MHLYLFRRSAAPVEGNTVNVKGLHHLAFNVKRWVTVSLHICCLACSIFFFWEFLYLFSILSTCRFIFHLQSNCSLWKEISPELPVEFIINLYFTACNFGLPTSENIFFVSPLPRAFIIQRPVASHHSELAACKQTVPLNK